MKHYKLLTILAFLFTLGTAASGFSEIADGVAAVVDGEAITFSMVEDAMNSIWTPPQKLPKSRQEALQQLIDHKLELLKARRLGVGVIVSENDLSLELAKIASRFSSPDGVSEALKLRGITQKALEEYLVEEIMVQKMVNRNFRNFVDVNELDVAAFYEQHKTEFLIPEKVNLSQIFFKLNPDAGESEKESVREKADGVLKELRNGTPFSKYTGEKETDDYVAVVFEYVSLGRLLPVVASAASRLEISEISDLINTPAGYFIIRLNDRRPARQASFDEVKDDIRELLIQQKIDADLEAWLVTQRAASDIRIKVDFAE